MGTRPKPVLLLYFMDILLRFTFIQFTGGYINMQDKENKNVIVMDTAVDQDVDAARIMLMMDMHQSLEDMNIANSDEY